MEIKIKTEKTPTPVGILECIWISDSGEYELEIHDENEILFCAPTGGCGEDTFLFEGMRFGVCSISKKDLRRTL